MKKISLKELLDDSTELGRARREQLAANFEEMLRRARTADLAWMDQETLEKEAKDQPHDVVAISSGKRTGGDSP